MRSTLRARWPDYRALLTAACEASYDIVSLNDWVQAGCPSGHRVFILRHDVDQHPRSALGMAAVERALGLTSTWYFRWRTAHPVVIGRLRDQGAHIGLHYETLSRLALHEGRADLRDDDVKRCRVTLHHEVRAFRARFGDIRSVCPHGDTRIAQVRNHVLLRGQDPAAFGVAFDGNEIMHGRAIGQWLTDRPAAAGRWKNRLEPEALLRDGVSPIFCVTHPHHWASRLSTGWDRALSQGLRGRSAASRPIRTGDDDPPW